MNPHVAPAWGRRCTKYCSEKSQRLPEYQEDICCCQLLEKPEGPGKCPSSLAGPASHLGGRMTLCGSEQTQWVSFILGPRFLLSLELPRAAVLLPCFLCPRYVTSPGQLKGRGGSDSREAVTQAPGGSFQNIQIHTEQGFLEPTEWSHLNKMSNEEAVCPFVLSVPPAVTYLHSIQTILIYLHNQPYHATPQHPQHLPSTGLHTCPWAVGTKGTPPKGTASLLPSRALPQHLFCHLSSGFRSLRIRVNKGVSRDRAKACVSEMIPRDMQNYSYEGGRPKGRAHSPTSTPHLQSGPDSPKSDSSGPLPVAHHLTPRQSLDQVL